MQGAWGKRALSAMAAGYKRNWNNLRGAWGKREMPAAVAKGQIFKNQQKSIHSPSLIWRFPLILIVQVSNGHESASPAGIIWKVSGAEK